MIIKCQYDLVSCDLLLLQLSPAQKHRHIRAFSSLYLSLYPLKNEEAPCRSNAERDIIYSKLKGTVRDSWLPDEHHALAIGFFNFLGTNFYYT